MAFKRRRRGVGIAGGVLLVLLAGYAWWRISRPAPPQDPGAAEAPAFLPIRDGWVIQNVGPRLIEREPTAEERESMERTARELQEAMHEVTFELPAPQ